MLFLRLFRILLGSFLDITYLNIRFSTLKCIENTFYKKKIEFQLNYSDKISKIKIRLPKAFILTNLGWFIIQLNIVRNASENGLRIMHI